MPLTPEQEQTYFEGDEQGHRRSLVGTWWYYLPTPDRPCIYEVVRVHPEELNLDHLLNDLNDDVPSVDVREIHWNGDQWVPQSPLSVPVESVRLPLDVLTGEFSSFWLLGDGGWLRVDLRPGIEVVDGNGRQATIASINNYTIGFGGSYGIGSGFEESLGVYEFLRTWRPWDPSLEDNEEGPESEGRIRVEVPGFAVGSAPSAPAPPSRFDRDPLD